VLSEISKILLEKVTVKSYPQQSLDYWYDYYVDDIQWYVDYYKAYGMAITFEQMAAQYLGLKTGEDWKPAVTERAKNNVKSRMIYHLIAQQNDLTVTDQDYRDMIKYFIDYYANSGYKYTEQQIIDGLGEETIRENALFENVDEVLFSNTTVTFKESK
jgi:FKBP-type peptidyl-prolyl cis-trans isomerase (trigger factor)